MDSIRLTVVFYGGSWRLKVGETLSRPYISESEAIRAALSRAHKLGQEGIESEVVMKVMTCRFGPKGLVRTVPTRSESSSYS